jgi:hypothetical protein
MSALHIGRDSFGMVRWPTTFATTWFTMCDLPRQSGISLTWRVKFALCFPLACRHWQASQAVFISKPRFPLVDHAALAIVADKQEKKVEGDNQKLVQYLPSTRWSASHPPIILNRALTTFGFTPHPFFSYLTRDSCLCVSSHSAIATMRGRA